MSGPIARGWLFVWATIWRRRWPSEGQPGNRELVRDGWHRVRLNSGRPGGYGIPPGCRAGLLIGALGLASAVFGLLRLVETWRVAGSVTSDLDPRAAGGRP